MRAKRIFRLAGHRYPASQVGRRAESRGFTLIELMVTIAIVGILASVAVPSFNEVMLSSKLNTLANNFVASTQLARSEAIKRNDTVALCASSDGINCTGDWKDGWIVLAGGTAVYTQSPLADGYLLSGDVTSINFQPTGVGATAASLTLCRGEPLGSQQRAITVGPTGRPAVKKVTGTSTCP